jgi:RNA polymerase sigma factor (sigma-70 family)
MRDFPPVTELVTRANHGEKQAWDAIVERYAPLIWSICRQDRLDDADAEDVGQMVWLHLVDHLGDLRDPAALPGWLATTTRRQCFRLRQAAARFKQVTGPLVDADNMADTEAVEAEHELLLAERHAALREAMSDLPPGYRELMDLLTAEPPVSYAEISARLGIPIGSIGPSRSRCLARLRRHPAIAALIDADAGPAACEDAS